MGRLLALACLAVAGCQPAADTAPRQLVAFGTLVTLRYYNTDDATANAATAALEQHYRQRERDWYPWSDGELATINASLARGEPVTVSADLKDLLERAAAIEAASGGLYNPALGALTELWGFHQPAAAHWRPPEAEAVRRLVAAAPGGNDLHWSGQTLSASSSAVVLDPGGIAKGALLQSSARILSRHGIDDAIVDLGGDLLVIGQAGRRDARIGIRAPNEQRALGWLTAQSGEAVMTSGNYERFFEYDGKRYHHVLDPRTGYPAPDTASVTVVARDPLLADAAATALLVAGPEDFERVAGALGIEFALLVSTSGDLRLTRGMQGRVHWL